MMNLQHSWYKGAPNTLNILWYLKDLTFHPCDHWASHLPCMVCTYQTYGLQSSLFFCLSQPPPLSLCHMPWQFLRSSTTVKSGFWSSGSFDICSIIMSPRGSQERRGRTCFYFWYPNATIKAVSSRNSCICGCAIWKFACISLRHLCPAVLTYFALTSKIE